MKKIILLIVSLMIVLSTSLANSYNPNLEIVSKKLVYCDYDKVIGTFDVKNKSDFYNSDIYYIVSLDIVRPYSEEYQVNEYYKFYEYKPVKIDIGANETKSITFENYFPKNIPENRYVVSVQLYSRTTDIDVPCHYDVGILGTEEVYLDKASYDYWEIDKEKIEPLSGPNVKDAPMGVVSLKSNLEEDIFVTPQYIIYKRLQPYLYEEAEGLAGKDILIEGGKTTQIKLEFPLMEEPESYLIHLCFLDEEGKQISSIYEFRYVLVGPSAKIISMTSDYNKENEKINISLNVVGPADASDLENVDIIYSIYNSADDSLILQKNFKETLTKELKTIKESLDFNSIAGDFRIEAEIRYKDEVLAQTENEINIKKLQKTEEMFTDLIGTKYLQAVKTLNGLNILNGYPDGTFKPYNPITRAEFTVIATKLANLGESDIQSAELTFTDVANEHWAKNFIILAYENGIISGYPDGTFKPDNNVSYQEALTILLNVMGYKWDALEIDSEWPKGYIEVANNLGMMRNVGEVDYASAANRGDVALLTLEAYLDMSK